MNKKILAFSGAALVVGTILGFGISRIGGDNDKTPASGSSEKKVLYWVAPMDPNFRRDGPGKSPMGMDLVPVYEGEEPGDGNGAPALAIEPAIVNNLGVETAPVERGTLHRQIDTIGFIAPNENLLGHVHIRTEGWIEELVVKTVGETVEAGDLLFRIYSPALVNAQAEYLQALQLKNRALSDAARERLVALGMAPQQISAIEKVGRVDQLTDVRAPNAGTVLALGVAEGMYVKPGNTIMTIADLSSVWAMVEIFEGQAAWVEEGQTATMRLAFAPGKAWEGVVDFVYPTVNPESRTVRVRLVFDNPERILKPNMYADIRIDAAAQENVIHIPRMALIQTEGADRVILAKGDGRFRPAQVVAGIEAGDRVEIIKGLEAGETVVTSGQFLIDSEASLDASLLRLTADMDMRSMKPGEEEPAAEGFARGTGTITALDPAGGKVTLTHGPIPELGWPAMTMGFSLKAGLVQGLSVGDHIRFGMMKMPDGSYMIMDVERMPVDGNRRDSQ